MRLPSGDHAGDVLVEGAGRQQLGLLRRDVEEVEVRALAAQVAVAVRLEVVAIDDDRLRRLRRARPCRLSAPSRLGGSRGIGVLDDEDQPLAVGRPGVVGDAALDVGELDRFAAGAVRAARPARCFAPCRDETNDRYRPSGLQRGRDSPSGVDVTWICWVPSQLTIQTSVSFLSVSRMARVTV